MPGEIPWKLNLDTRLPSSFLSCQCGPKTVQNSSHSTLGPAQRIGWRTRNEADSHHPGPGQADRVSLLSSVSLLPLQSLFWESCSIFHQMLKLQACILSLGTSAIPLSEMRHLFLQLTSGTSGGKCHFFTSVVCKTCHVSRLKESSGNFRIH